MLCSDYVKNACSVVSNTTGSLLDIIYVDVKLRERMGRKY